MSGSGRGICRGLDILKIRDYELLPLLRNFLECEDADGTSSNNVCIQLSKMILILCLFPKWIRWRKYEFMHLCFISCWKCLLLCCVDDDHVINVSKHVNWWNTQVLTRYPVSDVGWSCQTLGHWFLGNHCFCYHCFVTVSVLHMTWQSHYGLEKGRKGRKISKALNQKGSRQLWMSVVTIIGRDVRGVGR